MQQPGFNLYIAIVIIVFSVGCSAEQIYDGGQAWQRDQCRQMADQDGGKDCLSKTNRRYDDYQHETEKANQ